MLLNVSLPSQFTLVVLFPQVNFNSSIFFRKQNKIEYCIKSKWSGEMRKKKKKYFLLPKVYGILIQSNLKVRDVSECVQYDCCLMDLGCKISHVMMKEHKFL